MLYALLGYWVRRDACRLAAAALQACEIDEGYAPKIWSLTVFFERYLLRGASGTRDDFGPKEPAPLKAVATVPAGTR